MQATKAQKQYIHINTPNRDIKEEWVQWATNDVSKISCNKLTFTEANLIIKQLGGKPFTSTYRSWASFDPDNKQHRKILALCQNYGWQTRHQKTGRKITDLDKLDHWLRKHPKCPVRKPLKKMDSIELSKIILALEGMIKWKYR